MTKTRTKPALKWDHKLTKIKFILMGLCYVYLDGFFRITSGFSKGHFGPLIAVMGHHITWLLV